MAKTVDEVLTPFLKQVDAALSDGYSAVLYGSAARGDWVPGRSDVNLILVLDQLDPDRLRALEPAFAGWQKTQPEPPLLIGRREWAHAADSFPIEITDMQAAYRVLRGPDPLTGVTVQPADLRRAVERELRGKLLRLRQGFVALSGDPVSLGRLAVQSVPTIVLLCRSLAPLLGRPVHRDPEATVREAAAGVGFPAEHITRVLAHRDGSRWSCTTPVFLEYLAAVEQTARFVDQLQPGDQ